MRKTHIAFFLITCLALSLCQFEAGAAQKTTYITVAAGPLARQETIVSFALPGGLKAKSYELRDERGGAVALQVDADRQATFALPELKAGATKKYRLVESRAIASPANGVRATESRDKLAINVAGRKVLAFQAQPGELPTGDVKEIFRRGGYIHPVYTPSGLAVTDDYPPDHYHHHGIWFAWTKTEFEGRHPDFWNMGDGTGKVEFVALDDVWSGAVHGGFKSRQRFIDLGGAKPATALNEEWKVIVYNVGRGAKPYAMFDLVSTHQCATASPLVLPEYRYGGVGFRGHRQWLDKDNCFFLTSEGKDRNNGHGTRAKWCHIGGRVDGRLAGIAVLDHPGNFRAPQPMRINPDQPFFCYAPSQMGQWEITPGKPYVSRYRFIVADGGPDKAELDRLWNDYADPPQVTITVE
ncbi:MAG TPA: PmoA family protein [Blastocatellia bacterium]|nr:PmoA family protein [Blastocatellia bacterium]